MPTKSNNTGGRGGKRLGAGRKKKSLVEKLAKDADKIEFLDIPDMEGVDMPQPHRILSSKQRDGSEFEAAEIYKKTWEWLNEIGMARKISPAMIEKYAVASARWLQCEELTNQLGFLSKHPTTGKPIPSPFINIGINYMNQSIRIWNEILQIVKESCTAEYGEVSPANDMMEKLLRKKEGR